MTNPKHRLSRHLFTGFPLYMQTKLLSCYHQLEEVMEKETYKTAKDLLEKYDPNSELVQVSPVLRTLRQSDIHSGCFKSSFIYISSRQIGICPNRGHS